MEGLCKNCGIKSRFMHKKYCIDCITARSKHSDAPKDKKCLACASLTYRTRELCSTCFNKYMLLKSGRTIDGRNYIRELARIRDKHTCQSCDKKWEYGTRRFDIHHLEGLCGKLSRSCDSIKDLENLITLCHKCHLNLPEVKEKMSTKSSPRPIKDRAYQEKWLKINKPWLTH